MRNGSNELVSALVLGSTMLVTASCADFSKGASAGTGGGSAVGGAVGTGGSVNAGGAKSTGGSSNNGGAATGGATAIGPVTNLSATKVLGTLTTAEAAQLCSDSYAYFGRSISAAATCKWKGLVFGVSSSAPTDAMLQANCATKETACMQAGPSNATCGDLPSPCTATVAEYSACIADQATAFSQAVSGLASCATVTHADLEAVWAYSGAALPASCQALDITCTGADLPTPRN